MYLDFPHSVHIFRRNCLKKEPKLPHSIEKEDNIVKTGISGLDDIVAGGLPKNRFYLIEGQPGAGKTTIAIQFLMKGRELGESTMYITLSETQSELEAVARSHGWSLDGIAILDLSSARESLISETENTIFAPSEVELKQTIDYLFNEIRKMNPTRLVLDSLSEVRLLAQNDLRFRRQILGFKEFFADRACTVLMLDETFAESFNFQVQSIVHGVVTLSNLPPEYGAERRRLLVTKLRGVKFRGGFHDFAIRTGGIEVYPRLIAAEHAARFEPTILSTGVRGIDELLKGGIHSGSSTLLLGPAGTGKSSMLIQFVHSAATRGEKSSIFLFEETAEIYLNRARDLNLDLRQFLESGIVKIKHVDPAEFSSGELVQSIRSSIDLDGVRVVVLDSLNGYINSMPGERYLNLQLHELLTYLNQMGIVTFLVLAQQGIIGDIHAQVDLTYLADTVLLLRHFEAFGQVHQAISVLKKRTGDHERTLRQLWIDQNGVHVGKPLHQFQGVLGGIPQFNGVADEVKQNFKSKLES